MHLFLLVTVSTAKNVLTIEFNSVRFFCAMPELDVPLLKVAHLILRKTIAILIFFTSTETRLNHDLSLMVVINGTHATADISVKVMSLCRVGI